MWGGGGEGEGGGGGGGGGVGAALSVMATVSISQSIVSWKTSTQWVGGSIKRQQWVYSRTQPLTHWNTSHLLLHLCLLKWAVSSSHLIWMGWALFDTCGNHNALSRDRRGETERKWLHHCQCRQQWRRSGRKIRLNNCGTGRSTGQTLVAVVTNMRHGQALSTLMHSWVQIDWEYTLRHLAVVFIACQTTQMTKGPCSSQCISLLGWHTWCLQH